MTVPGGIPTARPVDEAAYVERSPRRTTTTGWWRAALWFTVAVAVIWALAPHWWLVVTIGVVHTAILFAWDRHARRRRRSPA